MTGFSNSNPPINRSVVHTTQHRCVSPSLTHTNHREINISVLSFVLPRPKVNPCMVDSLICRRRVQPLRPANVCMRWWSSSIADGRNKSHEVSFPFFSPRLSLLAFWEPWKKVHILCKRPVTATLSVYDFQHPGHQAPCMNAPLLYLYLAVYL